MNEVLGREVYVSNRGLLNFTITNGGIRSSQAIGGLSTAIGALVEAQGGDLTDILWVSGNAITKRKWYDIPKRKRDTAIVQSTNELGFGIGLVNLSEDEMRSFYETFSNGVLWPVAHGFGKGFGAEYAAADDEYEAAWKVYKNVNKKYATGIKAKTEENDRIFVQDYQLIGVGAELRKMGRLDQQIDFFLHIPFPTVVELVQNMDRRHIEYILKSMLQYDLVGFQRQSDKDNFFAALGEFLPGKVLYEQTVDDVDIITFENRRLKLGAFLIGLNPEPYMEAGNSDEVIEGAAAMKEYFAQVALDGRDDNLDKSPEKIVNSNELKNQYRTYDEILEIIGTLGRLDPSKGDEWILEAFEEFLRQVSGNKMPVLVHNAAPSRENVPAYAALKKRVAELDRRINQEAKPALGYEPIRQRLANTERKLANMYMKLADIFTIPSIRDGCNLVAEEYPLVNDRGVLIVSKGAGVVEILGENGAIEVDPQNPQTLVNALLEAYNMPIGERKERAKKMRETIMNNTVFDWAKAINKARAIDVNGAAA
ncbi:MAG TPA: trehalose-6-phosphate synthase [Candidatus Dojkabacteria bacterium]|jgi:trehalose 6-phosphate synthase